MRGRFASFLLTCLLLLVGAVPSRSSVERRDRALSAETPAAERLYLPSSAPLTRAVVVAARSEPEARIERRRLEVEAVRGLADRDRWFAPDPPDSHDKRPLSRRSADDPPH